MTDNLSIIKNFVTDSFGIKIPDELLADLQRNVNLFCEDFNMDETRFIEKIKNNSFSERELKSFINIITVGETHFFRDQKLFNELQSKIFPDLLKNKQILNALSLGCSTGEEPYSLAIVFDKVSKDFNNKKLIIDSVDVNKISLAKAKEGIYSEWSFRNTPQWVKGEYFTYLNNSYHINKNIKESVNFEFFNLTEIGNKFVFPNIHYDIIICRNIFIYFEKDIIKNILDYIYTHLTPDGIFITSPSEAGYIDTSKLKKLNQLNSSIFIKKTANCVSAPIKTPPIINKKNIQAESTVKSKRPAKEFQNLLDANLNFEYLFNKGKENYKAHKYDEAFIQFFKCSTLIPLEVKPYFYMGLIKQELGEFTEAKKYLQKALFLSPKEIGVLTVYHNLLVNLNDNEHALISKRLKTIPFEDKQNYKDDLFNLV